MLLSDLFGFQRVSGFSSASAECKADFNDEKGTGRNDCGEGQGVFAVRRAGGDGAGRSGEINKGAGRPDK